MRPLKNWEFVMVKTARRYAKYAVSTLSSAIFGLQV